VAEYEVISSTAVSADPAVAVPLQAINGWIVMQRRVPGGTVSFEQNWAAYRDGFGSAAGNDNYWMGLDKVYRLVQLGSATLRVEVCKYTDSIAGTSYFSLLFVKIVEYMICLMNAFSDDSRSKTSKKGTAIRVSGTGATSQKLNSFAFLMANISSDFYSASA